ncbi:hypothetical protein GQ44DRAFT_700758 [Phaeosphaeriaceae sp. PMI808]|nr:hypothetical protein GQ44DRAFT_700758 [Phaeosphaeriaceae sp. PMI808]
MTTVRHVACLVLWLTPCYPWEHLDILDSQSPRCTAPLTIRPTLFLFPAALRLENQQSLLTGVYHDHILGFITQQFSGVLPRKNYVVYALKHFKLICLIANRMNPCNVLCPGIIPFNIISRRQVQKCSSPV